MTTTMNPKIRDLWADALESGKYQQAKGVLARVEVADDGNVTPVGFCCLGVLCDLAAKAGVIPTPTLTEDGDGDPVFEYGTYDYYSFTGLPRPVAEWAGLVDPDTDAGMDDPVLEHPVNGTADNASQWNDVEHATFAEIAVMVRAIPAREGVSA